jgi:hypothetical protein
VVFEINGNLRANPWLSAKQLDGLLRRTPLPRRSDASCWEPRMLASDNTSAVSPILPTSSNGALRKPDTDFAIYSF